MDVGYADLFEVSLAIVVTAFFKIAVHSNFATWHWSVEPRVVIYVVFGDFVFQDSAAIITIAVFAVHHDGEYETPLVARLERYHCRRRGGRGRRCRRGCIRGNASDVGDGVGAGAGGLRPPPDPLHEHRKVHEGVAIPLVGGADAVGTPRLSRVRGV